MYKCELLGELLANPKKIRLQEYVGITEGFQLSDQEKLR